MPMQNSSDVLIATAIEYLKGVTDQTQRGRLVLAWMKKGGLVVTGGSGHHDPEANPDQASAGPDLQPWSDARFVAGELVPQGHVHQ